MHYPALLAGEDGDGGMAVAAELADDLSLKVGAQCARGIVQWGEKPLCACVIAAALKRERALAGSGENFVKLDRRHKRIVEEIGAFHAGHRKDDRVELAAF